MHLSINSLHPLIGLFMMVLILFNGYYEKNLGIVGRYNAVKSIIIAGVEALSNSHFASEKNSINLIDTGYTQTKKAWIFQAF